MSPLRLDVVSRLAQRRQVREIAEQRKVQRAVPPVAVEEMLERNYTGPGYEHPIDEINWRTVVGRPAGVYWLGGQTVIAAYDSPAEARLIDDGAVLIATLSFEPDSLESVHPMAGLRHVERLTATRVAHELMQSAVN